MGEKEAGEEAAEKAFCDEQMAKTEAKKSELEEDIAKMTSRIDQAAADSAQLKEETFPKASGAGGGIINILEVCESDFATNLAKEETEEADAQAEYEKVSQENAVTKTLKEQDVKYKTQEAKAQDNTVAEYSGDREAAQTELTAVLDFYAKIKERCIAKPEGYEERRRRREAEINGLKEALSIL